MATDGARLLVVAGIIAARLGSLVLLPGTTSASTTKNSPPDVSLGGAPTINSVSGSFSHGLSFTLTGKSFATKSHAGPMLWDDFDSRLSGSVVAGPAGGTQPLIHQGNLVTYAQWKRGGGGAISAQSILFNASSPKANSSRHARATFSNRSYWGLNLIVPYTKFN